jgi:hypothetical protein
MPVRLGRVQVTQGDSKDEDPMRFAVIVVSGLWFAAATMSVARAECVALTPKAWLEKPSTELVFGGTVVEIVRSSGARYRATFEVDRVWKGTVTERVTIYSSDLVVESPRFQHGETHVVVAQRLTDDEARKRVGLQPLPDVRATPGPLRDSHGGEFTATTCSGGMAMSMMIRDLGPGTRPASRASR